MTTAQQIIDRILRPMRDSAGEIWPSPYTELLEYINEAIVDLASRERLVHEQDTTVAASAGGILLANVGAGGVDVLQLRWVLNAAGNEATWTDPSTFKLLQLQDPTRPSDDLIAAVWASKIWLHPAPADATNFIVGYYGTPVLMTAPADTISLPLVWDAKLVHFGRAQCHYRLQDEAMGDREMAQYAEGLHTAHVFDRNEPGIVSLGLELGPFDVDPDASQHL